jgi:hypothetical protein
LIDSNHDVPKALKAWEGGSACVGNAPLEIGTGFGRAIAIYVREGAIGGMTDEDIHESKSI